MVFTPLRYVLLASAVAMATTSSLAAADDGLTPFPVEYDALTYVTELLLEISADIASDNEDLKTAVDTLADDFHETAAKGSLTVANVDATLGKFYAEADNLVAGFSTQVTNKFSVEWNPTRFLNDLHPATWDIIQYGITTVEVAQTAGISGDVQDLEGYMNENVLTSTNSDTDELNSRLASFFESLDISDFEAQVQDAIYEMVKGALNEETPGPDPTSPSSLTGDTDGGSSPAPVPMTQTPKTQAPPTVINLPPRPASKTPSSTHTTPATQKPTSTPSPKAKDGSVAKDAEATRTPSPTTTLASTKTPASTFRTTTTTAPSKNTTNPVPSKTAQNGAAVRTTLALAASFVVSAALSLLI